MIKSQKNIVLLHGWGASVDKLKPLQSELTKLGWDVTNLKLPGFDNPTPQTAWDLSDYAEYVLRSAKKKYDSFYLFGHSFGGRIVIKIAGDIAPQDKHVSGIVLCSAGGLSRGNILKRAVFYVLAKCGKPFLLYKPLANVWKKVLYTLAREHDYEKADTVLREIFKNVVSEDLKNVTRNIRYKTLVLWGEDDRMTPLKDGQIVARNVKGATLKIYSGFGHTLPYNNAKELADTINTWIHH